MFWNQPYLICLVALCYVTNCSSIQSYATENNGWYGSGCPPHATGQFPYLGDCKRFYNCYKGRGQLTVCAPGTLFNPSTLECDFPSKVKCLKNDGKAGISKTGNLEEQYPAHHHHHSRHHHYRHHHHHDDSQQYSQVERQDLPPSEWPTHQHQSHNTQYHSKQPLSNNYYTDSGSAIKTKVGYKAVEKSAIIYHGGVQPPGTRPSLHLEPPPPPTPIYIQNPFYIQPSLPAQNIPGQRINFQAGSVPAETEPTNPTPPPHQPPVYIQNPFYIQPSLPAQNIPGKRINFQAGTAPAETEQPSRSQNPVYIQNPYYGKPAQNVPGQGINFQGGSIPVETGAYSPSTYQQPINNQYSPDQYSSRAHNAPTPGNQYQPSVPRQVYHTKTSESNSYEKSSSAGNPSYVEQPFPSYPQVDPGTYPSNSEHEPRQEPSPKPYNDKKDICPKGFSGLMAHSDCKKFLSCSHGRTFAMNCSPGTRFNSELKICDHDYTGICEGSQDYDPPTPKFKEDDTLQPPKTNPEINAYRSDKKVTERIRPPQSVETEPGESITQEIPKNDEGEFSIVHVVTEKSLHIDSIIPRIIIENRNQDKIIKDNQNNPKNPKQTFKPDNLPVSRARFISKRNSTLDKQILRLRGSPSQFEGFVEMQLSTGSWGVVCDKHNDWKIEEAHVVCKSLGFPRGAEISWQGLPADVKNTSSNILATDTVSCTGSEDSLLDCTFSVGDGCDPKKDGVWVRCYSHGLSKCFPGEMSLGDRCYSLVVPNEESPTENLVGFTQGEALAHCQKKGGHLVDITSQVENDFVSEWLIRQNITDNIMTSGVGMSLMGGSIWIWEGSESTFTYHNWWPGWNGETSIPPKTYTNRALCIVLKRHFPCKDSNATEDRLCDTQYYYWDVEDCDAMPFSLPYVCERAANKIGCVMGTGAGYKGAANVTKAGNLCLSWDHEHVLQELKYRISEEDRKVSLSGHNYCRNIAGKETHPWCFVRETPALVKKELCDIPICSAGLEKSARYFQCPVNYFSCGISGKCIPMSQVCDGNSDCTDSEDESDCQLTLSQFSLFENSKLIVPEVEVFIKTPLTSCAQRCLELANCRSFSFLVAQKECVLAETNIGLSGSLSNASGWNYYELNSKSIQCKNSFVCDNGKCISQETVCNGRNDCGDRSDEKNCTWLKQKIQIKLTGGSRPNEGNIQVKAHDRWGLICDDEFEQKDADVVCRHLGYPLGALEIKKHSFFPQSHSMSFLIDNLNCVGNESSIADCFHNGWGIHDCQAEECVKAAGVVCKIAPNECSFNYWQCEKSAECIPLAFLCDKAKDCKDHSDEDPARCKSPVQVRLVGTGGVSRSNKVNEGRVEVSRFGIWGTVCDDDFGPEEANVVCRALGYNGSAEVYKEAAYGAGNGIIWLDQVHCLGNESNIQQCMSDGWGRTNCKHNEDVAVACSNLRSNEEGAKKHPIFNKNKSPPDNVIEMGTDDISLEELLIPDCGTVKDMPGAVKNRGSARVVSGFETIKGTYPWQKVEQIARNVALVEDGRSQIYAAHALGLHETTVRRASIQTVRQASIRVKTIIGKSTHWCGAVVISRYHVLTAGHCFRDYAKSAYFVRAGDYDNEVDEGTEQDMEIDEMWIHSHFDKGVNLNNDIALVKIKGGGFEFNNWVLPACLPQGNPQIPNNCTISGWGSSSNPGTGFARTLHATWLTPLSPDECRNIDTYSDALSTGMMCAGSLEGGPDSCQGDSGGPLLCPINNQLTLFGITSWGHGCGRSNSPGVYTNVPYYMDWINNRIKISMKKQKFRKN